MQPSSTSECPPATRLLERLGIVLLNAVFYPLLVLFTVLMVVGTAIWLIPVKLFSSQREFLRRLRHAIHFYGTGVIRVLPFPWVRLRYEAEEVLERDRAYILVSNHRAASDAFLMACLPVREIIQIVSVWPMKIPVWGYFARVAGFLSVHEMPADQFLATGTARLKEGVSIGVFPEGHRSGCREMLPFNSAGFRLAQAANVPLVPICVSGNERVPPKGSMFLRPGCVRVRQLKPLQPEYWKGMNPTCLKLRVRKMIQDELDRMEGIA